MQFLLEQQIAQKTQELATSNDEPVEVNQEVRQVNAHLLIAIDDLKRSKKNLQQFAHVVSHDLQKSQPKSQSFSILLAGQLESFPDDSVREHLQRITKAGQRMSTLINDLLAYSWVGTRKQASSMVSLSAIVTGVLMILNWTIQQKGAQMQVTELPYIKSDESSFAAS